MEHLSSIMWLLSWPALIIISYKVCTLTIKLFERNNRID